MPRWDNFRWKKPTNTPKRPSTHWVVIERVTQVGRLIIQWYQRYEIVAIWQEKWDLSASQIDDYIKRARERIKAKNDKTIGEEIEETAAQIMDVYQWARRDKKWGDASRALKLKMELRGLEAPKKMIIQEIDPEDEELVQQLLMDNE